MREAVTRRKSKALIWVACWAVLLAGLALEGGGQEVGERAERKRLPELPYIVEGDELLEYTIVGNFFETVDRLINIPPAGFYEPLLEKFGIAKGSETDELLRKTAAEVTRISNINPFDTSLDADAFVQRQREIQLSKVTEIGRCYGSFLAKLQSLGEDIDRFKELMDAEVRSTVSIAFDQPEGFELLQQWQEAFSQASAEAFAANGTEQEKRQ